MKYREPCLCGGDPSCPRCHAQPRPAADVPSDMDIEPDDYSRWIEDRVYEASLKRDPEEPR